MKRNIFKYWFFILSCGLLFAACQDEYELGEVLPVETLQYEITQNPDDPNMVILESLTPNVTPMWTTPMGRSTRVKDTVLLPFEGTYKFVYGVQSGGGYVSADTVVLTLTTQNLSYVDHPLWDLLTGGGVGNSKTWVLDLNAEGVSKYFAGPQYFFGTDNGWEGECLVDGGDCWSWEPDWAGNQWIADVGDYGEMTFSLEGGAFLTANHQMIPSRGQESGTYFLDAGSYTLTSSDASPLHSPNTDACVNNWYSARIFSLTEDYMQLGFVRDASCDGEAMLVFNYISKEYSDNWVPEDTPDPEPPYDGDANTDLTTDVSTTKTWKVNLDYPYNWHDLAGTPLNEVATYGGDPEGFAFTTWTPPYDEAVFSSISMELTKVDASSGTYVIQTETGEVTGNYTVNENNEIDFGQPITFFSGVGGWLGFSTTAENTLRIIAAEQDAFGNVTGIWLGQKAADKDEYLSLHLEVVSGEVDPMDAWVDALAGKTFMPDVNWFVDWVGLGPDFSGGWTSSGTFGDDYTTNSWIWTEDTRSIAESASLYFFIDGDQMKVTVSQTLTTEHEEGGSWVTDDVNTSYSVTGNVNIDTEGKVLTIDVPLIDYAGSPARWLLENGTNDTGEWFFVSHGGSNLSNIDTEGFWLGYTSPPAEGEEPSETTIFHYIVK